MFRRLVQKLKLFLLLRMHPAVGAITVHGVRSVITPAPLLTATRDRLADIGPAAKRFMYEAGKEGGHAYASSLEDAYGPFSAEDDFVTASKQFANLTGWGRLEIVEEDYDEDRFTIHIYNTLFHGPADETVDEYHAGLLAGAAEVIIGRPMDVKEVACADNDTEHCVFEMRPEGEFTTLFPRR